MSNNPYFELVSKYSDTSLLPTRGTASSAGYDFCVANDIVIPSYFKDIEMLKYYCDHSFALVKKPYNLEDVAQITKESGVRPTLVPTGVKAYIPSNQYLQLSIRSSCPLKYWLILANGEGIIDSDYYNNPSNEGEIFFQIINLFPQDIILKKGDKIGQGIFLPYNLIKNDKTVATRVGGFGSTSK